MQTIHQNELLDQLEEKVDAHLRTAIGQLQNLPPAILLRPAGDGGWSIAQCLEHLNTYGRFYLPQIERKLASASPPRSAVSFRSSWLGSYFTRSMDPATSSRKMKAFKGHIPERDLDAPAVIAEFIQQQETLLKLIRKARQVDLRAIRIPISLTSLIRLKLGDVFQFLVAHDERHLQQAKRNLPQEALSKV